MPSFNEITGDRISSGAHVKGTDKEAFASGWDLLWGKKEQPVIEEFTEFPVEVECTTVVVKPDCKCHIYTQEDEDWFFSPNDGE